MYCTDCGSRNPSDSKFCRECGRKIFTVEGEARLAAARESSSINIDTPVPPAEPDRLRHLLDMAFWHNEVGNVSGAVAACEAALKVDPNSTSALSLLGCLFEKQGKEEKAIQAFERVVELNPDSVADYEKLEHLLRGIRDKAISPSLVHQLTPPVLLQVSRKYPSLPVTAASIAAFALILVGISLLWVHGAAGRTDKGASTSFTATGDPTVVGPNPGNVSNVLVPRSTPSSNTQVASSAIPPAPPQYHDPFTQDPGLMDRMAQAQNQGQNQNNETDSYRRDDRQGYSSSAPSYQALRPLAVPASNVPDHVVQVEPSSTNDHVVMVNPTSQNDSNSDGNADSNDEGAPTPPPSHIFVNVHADDPPANSTTASQVPSDSSSHEISLRENAGASLQQKALNLQEAGNYKAAEATYQAAIAAYEQDITNGRSTDEAKRGIEACGVAVEICKQSQ